MFEHGIVYIKHNSTLNEKFGVLHNLFYIIFKLNLYLKHQ